MPRPIAELIASKPDARRLVEDGLNYLEAEHRELSLVSLAAWCRVLTPASDLFDAVASMRRPAWGAWDRLMQALGRCQAHVSGRQLDTPRRRAAERLGGVVRLLDERVEAAPLRPLAQLTGTRLPRDARVAAILRLPIPLRNRIAHGPPATADGWKVIAEALEPLLRWHAQRGLAAGLNDPDARPAPWFLPPLKPGEPARAFNGLQDDGSAIYAGPDGWEFSPEAGAEVRLLLCRLLGREEVREADFRRLLPLLAPRERQGVLLGDYLLGAPVDGRVGADASVHEGWELGTGRKVALKVLRAASSPACERFRREARHLARFSQANVVGLYDSGEERWRQPPVPVSGLPWLEELKREPTRTFIAMEWVDGRTLENVIRAGRAARPGDRELAGWFLQAADALSAVHAAGLLHRDVKPSNLMVTAGGAVKLMDFGIADDRSAPEHGPTTARMGTPPYMSPEQVRAADTNAGDEQRARVGPASDLYGLCATFYELYTGRRLYDHDSAPEAEVLQRKRDGVAPAMPRRRSERLPWEIETILLGGLEGEPSRRYGSAEELKRDLRLYLEDRPIERKRPSLLRRVSLGYRRNRVVTNLLAVAAVLFVLGAAQYVAVLKREQSATEEYAEGLGRQEKETRKYAQGLEEQQRETVAKAKEVQTALARWHLSAGRRYHEAGDSLSALPHYVEALALDAGDADRERPHRVRPRIPLLDGPPRLFAGLPDPRGATTPTSLPGRPTPTPPRRSPRAATACSAAGWTSATSWAAGTAEMRSGFASWFTRSPARCRSQYSHNSRNPAPDRAAVDSANCANNARRPAGRFRSSGLASARPARRVLPGGCIRVTPPVSGLGPTPRPI